MSFHHLLRRSLLSALAGALLAGPVSAHTATAGAIDIGHAWAPPSYDRATQVYVALINRGDVSDRLIAASCRIATRVEFRLDDATDRAVDSFDLPPGRGLNLRPGGRHIVLYGLARPLHHGDRVPLTLAFESAGPTTIEVWIEPAPYAPQSG